MKPGDFEGVPDEETVAAATVRCEETTKPQAEYGNVLEPEDFEGVPATEHSPETVVAATEHSEETVVEDGDAVVAATEHSVETTRPQAELDTQELPAGQTMVYSIVNEFLG